MKEMFADLDGLRLSLLFLDECPVTWSRFHACVKGQERPGDPGFSWATKASALLLPLVVVF